MKIGKVCMKIPSVQDVSASSETEGIFFEIITVPAPMRYLQRKYWHCIDIVLPEHSQLEAAVPDLHSNNGDRS